MQRFWFLCVAMMVLGGCMADTRGLHMDGGNDDIVEPMDGGNDDIVEPMDGGNDDIVEPMDGGNDDGSIVEPRYVALVPTGADWQQAGDACARLGGHLPEPSTPEAQAALEGFVVATGIDQHFWIGLIRDLTGEYERWSFSGEPLSFTNWEETNPSYGPEACVEFRVTDRFTWNDLPCSEMLAGNIVCEMP